MIADLELTGDSYYGYPPLIEAIAAHRGVEPERVLHTMGTSLANHIAMAALADPGDDVLIETPTYELLVSTAAYLGLRVRRFERRFEEAYALDPDRVRAALTPRTKLVVLTNLHNPSSALAGAAVLSEVGRAAGSVGARVLVDEAYLDAAFGAGAVSAAELGDGFVTTSSLTKAYGLSGLRCGWVTAGPSLVTRMWRLKDLFDAIPPHPAERLSVVAFRQLDVIAKWSAALLAENHREVSAFLRSHPDLAGGGPGFGTVVFPRFGAARVAALETVLGKKYETAVAPGSFFDAPDHFRLSCSLEPAKLKEGLRRLDLALSEVR
jgi:aspartate/methionine/tyrosine aminotransferase